MDNLQTCLANNMKRYRKQRNLSQEKLAEKAGASANYIAMIENGRNFPSLPMLRQIADALGVDALALFDKAALEYPNLESLRADVLESVMQAVNKSFDGIMMP